MPIALDSVPQVVPTTTVALTVVERGTDKIADLAVCEDATRRMHLCKWRPERPARVKTDKLPARDARPAAWIKTSLVSDVARAISGGLLA